MKLYFNKWQHNIPSCEYTVIYLNIDMVSRIFHLQIMHPCLHLCTFVGLSLQDKFLEGEFLSQRVCALEMLRDFAELCFSNATPIYTPKKGTSMQFLYSFMRACTQSINQLINHSVNKILSCLLRVRWSVGTMLRETEATPALMGVTVSWGDRSKLFYLLW